VKIILDTNVIASGLLAPYGAPGEIARLAGSGAAEVGYDARILSEYRRVLRRPQFGFDSGQVSVLLQFIETHGFHVLPHPLPHRLADPGDEAFLEASQDERSECLVTGNLKHFPPPVRGRARILSPVEFLALYRERG
jgi:predicted nucleic acid-binding protein